MDWREVYRRFLSGLRREWRSSSVPTSEIEERLEICDGYFGKLCREEYNFKLPLFLRSIDALGLDPRAFFARALDLQPEAEDILWQLEESGEVDRAFQRMAHATRELEATEPPAADPRATATAEDVAAVAGCPRKEQLRRLSAFPKYRSHAFARAYLEHLDSLRYDDAELAARLATRVAVRLIPALPGPREDRLALQCLALGVFGSALRLKGRFALAARVLRQALELSRRAGLREDRGNLLLRASYVLKNFGHFKQALAFVNEAVVIFVELGSETDVGRALLDKGIMQNQVGEYERTTFVLHQARMKLKGNEQLNSDQLALYQNLAIAYEHLGLLEQAHKWLEEGATTFPPDHASDAAKLRWLRGRLAFRNGQYERAEGLLRIAGAVLADNEFPGREALVSLDLISVLLAQGRSREAAELAAGMAPLLFRFKNNRVAEAAVLELISAAAEGELHERVVHAVREKLEGERTPGRTALSRR